METRSVEEERRKNWKEQARFNNNYGPTLERKEGVTRANPLWAYIWVSTQVYGLPRGPYNTTVGYFSFNYDP